MTALSDALLQAQARAVAALGNERLTECEREIDRAPDEPRDLPDEATR